MVSHWLTPTVFVSVSRSDRLACASCLWFDTLIVQWQDQCLLLASLSLEHPLFFLCFFQLKTSFCLLGQWICQLYCSYIGLNSSSSCFSLLVCGLNFPLCFHFPCLEIVPFFFLLDSLPAQKSRSYSATRVDMFGSHGHIMNFSTCRARVIRWPVGRIVHSKSHASQTKTRGQQRDC